MSHYPQHLTDFLVSQHVLALATYAGGEQPGVCNLYYVVDEHHHLYFVSKKLTAHCKHIHLHPQVAFSVCWYAPDHFTDRRIIQGEGSCHILDNAEEIHHIIPLFHEKFPEFKAFVTDALALPKCELGMYRIVPTMLKFGDGHYLDGQAAGEVWIA